PNSSLSSLYATMFNRVGAILQIWTRYPRERPDSFLPHNSAILHSKSSADAARSRNAITGFQLVASPSSAGTLSNLRNESAHPKHLRVEAVYEIQFPLAPKISRESRIGSLGDGKSFVGSPEARSRHPRAP